MLFFSLIPKGDGPHTTYATRRDRSLAIGPKYVRGNWPLWSTGGGRGVGSRGHPVASCGLPLPPVDDGTDDICIVPKFQVRHWHQYPYVRVYRPYSQLSRDAQTFPPSYRNLLDLSYRLRGSRIQRKQLSTTNAWIHRLCYVRKNVQTYA